jgi:hypothetical protein
VSAGLTLRAQKVDSIFFNLYTDSLKKGTYNYINVEAKLSSGQWMPLTNKELKFSCASGKFDGNSLFIDSSFKEEKVKVKVELINNPAVTKEITIYIKKYIPDERLKTVEEILGKPPKKNKSIKKSGTP